MRGKSKVKIVIGVLIAIFLFANCQDNSQKATRELPEAPVQTASVPSPAPVEKETPVPSPVPAEDLALPEPSPEEPQPDEDPQTVTYILNTNTKKFHKPSCRSAKQIKPGNRQETGDAREDLLARGYSPCGNCKP